MIITTMDLEMKLLPWWILVMMIFCNADTDLKSECGGEFEVGNGKIHSPNYPNDYPSSLICHWHLQALEHNHINMEIHYFNVEESEDCSYDSLEIYDGPSMEGKLLAKLCGTLPYGSKLITNTNEAVIRFVSDASREYQGFELSYKSEDLVEDLLEDGEEEIENYIHDVCNQTLTSLKTSFSSPMYPDVSPDSTSCYTQILVPPGYTLQLRFKELETEWNQNCSYDYVLIKDGPGPESPVLGVFCGSEVLPEPILSTSNSLFVFFHLDDLISSKGFLASYQAFIYEIDEELGGCIWKKGISEGSISSPNFPDRYPPNSECVFKIKVPKDHFIELLFDQLALEDDPSCVYDYVEVRDGFEYDANLLGRFCGNEMPHKVIRSSGPTLYVYFVSDYYLQTTGFQAFYHAVPNKVGGFPDIYSPESHSLEFLNSPQNATVKFGTNHTLSCVSNKPSIISWLKGSNDLSDGPLLDGIHVEGQYVYISHMNERHAGEYTCIAMSGLEIQIASAWISLMLPDSEDCDHVFLKRPEGGEVTEGEMKILKCYAGLDVKVIWLKNGIEIPQADKHLKILANNYLLIQNMHKEDSGEYTCLAIHKHTDCVIAITTNLTVREFLNINNICGLPNIDPMEEVATIRRGKIVSGRMARKQSAPWQVMLWNQDVGPFCGGVLINEQWLLTAAHCFVEFEIYTGKQPVTVEDFILRLGKYDRQVQEPHEIQMQAEIFVIHPKFDGETYDNDLALIKLHSKISFNNYILPICLKDNGDITDTEAISGTVTGWGSYIEKGTMSRNLMEIRLPIVKQETCQSSTEFLVTENMFCAGYAMQFTGDACKGDSGGPFILKEENKWVLAGLVSWGEGCAREGKYGFYTKVTNYYTWIHKTISQYST